MIRRIRIDSLREDSVCTGRNGTFQIGVLRLEHTTMTETVYFDPISCRRGILLNGGMHISTDDMDRLADAWVRYRKEKKSDERTNEGDR